MDLTTLAGFAIVVFMVILGAVSGQLPKIFLNWHGIIIVCGGTLCAILINTPMALIMQTFGSLSALIRGSSYPRPNEISTDVLELAQRVQSRGAAALRDVPQEAVGGYLAYAAQAALEYNDPDLVERMLADEINGEFDRRNEVINVFRTMGVLAPMFGLLGTLIGIVAVLRQIADPDQVGPAMAIAVTTAFYGIAISNIFCTPVAGKLRLLYQSEMRVKSMVAEGIVMMLRRSAPSVIERKLKSYW